jgi:hypothetical protein
MRVADFLFLCLACATAEHAHAPSSSAAAFSSGSKQMAIHKHIGVFFFIIMLPNPPLRLLIAVVFSNLLLCNIAAVPTLALSSFFNDPCDCPKPDQCDKHFCPGGCFYSSTLRLCIPASVGFYAQLTNETASNIDTPCPCGSFTSVSGSVACKYCPAGQFTSNSASKSCDACPVGTECPFAGLCNPTPCFAGTYNPSTGSVACTPCPEGTYNPLTGCTSSAACSSCPAGTYSPTAGSISIQRPPIHDCPLAPLFVRFLLPSVCRMHCVPPWVLLP